MKRLLTLIVSTILFLTGCTLENSTGTGSASDAAFFSIPSSLIGGITPPTSIATDPIHTVNQFYTYGKDQVNYADEAVQQIKALIAELESIGLLDYGIDVVLEDRSGNGDIYRWTIGPSSNEYFLEWWKISAEGQYRKFLELHLDELIRCDEAASAKGYIIVAPPIDSHNDWYGNPDWIHVDFDSSTCEGFQYMEIQMEGFLGTGLADTGTYQNGIFKAWKSPEGRVDLISSVRVSGLKSVNYEAQDDPGETRYYLFSGTSHEGKGSISLSMPHSYSDLTTVFSNSTIGDVIKEYLCDQMRDNFDFDGDDMGDGRDYLNDLGFTAPYSNSPVVNPTTNDIYYEVSIAYNSAPDETLENLLYMMEVSNPAYFSESSYEGYGAAPSGYAVTVPEFTISQSEVDNLSDTVPFTVPGDTPPTVTE